MHVIAHVLLNWNQLASTRKIQPLEDWLWHSQKIDYVE